MYNEPSSTKALDVRGFGPTAIRDEVKKLSRAAARAILTEITSEANARCDELNALAPGNVKKKWKTLTAEERTAQQGLARRKFVAAQRFGVFAGSALLEALTRQAYGYETSLGNVFTLRGLSENAIKERVSNLSPDEVSEVFELIEALAEPRKPDRYYNKHSPEPHPLSWKFAARTYFGLTFDDADNLYFALLKQDQLSFKPDLMHEIVERLRSDLALTRELLERIELRAQKLVEQYPDVQYGDAMVFALQRMLGANARDAQAVLHCITWDIGAQWSILQRKPRDMSSIPSESARRYVAMIDALVNNPLFGAWHADPENSAPQFLFDLNQQDAQALRERACETQPREIKPLVELAAGKVNSGAASAFLSGTITLTSDTATSILEKAAARTRADEFIVSLRKARAKAFKERQGQVRSHGIQHEP